MQYLRTQINAKYPQWNNITILNQGKTSPDFCEAWLCGLMASHRELPESYEVVLWVCPNPAKPSCISFIPSFIRHSPIHHQWIIFLVR
jgi:hypothetical protein